MYVCMYVCVNLHMYMRAAECTGEARQMICNNVGVYIHLCMDGGIYVCMYVRVYLHTYMKSADRTSDDKRFATMLVCVCMYVCMYVCKYVYMHAHM